MSYNNIEVLLSMLRVALLGRNERLPSSVEWPEVMRLAAMHGNRRHSPIFFQ